MPATDTQICDITIIGGGPVGLFAAFYAGLRGMKTRIVDSLDQLGGQLTTLYPEKFVYDVAGFPKIVARDLARNLVDQAMQYNPEVFLQEKLDTLVLRPDQNCLELRSANNIHLTRTAIICAGAGAFEPKRLPHASAKPLEGSGVHYAVRDKSLFHGKRILIVGGGDSAIDWAANLHGTAARVTLIHRRNQFRAHEDGLAKAVATGAEILTFCELKSIGAADGALKEVTILHNQTGALRTIEVDAILAQIGFSSSLGPIKTWPLQIQGNAIPVDPFMQTSIPGVFAAGDVCCYKGKLKLIATGFGEACVAVNYAKTLTDPNAHAFPGHSSDSGPQVVSTFIDNAA